MAKDLNRYFEPSQANESIDKYKLLSAYGGPGSIVHTQYGSIIISCIEEWGFLKKILELKQRAIDLNKQPDEIRNYVIEEARHASNGSICISNDSRLLQSLIHRKGLNNLEYLVLFPDIELKLYNNKVADGRVPLAIPSTFMPKVFVDRLKQYRSYKEWFSLWCKVNDDRFGSGFFPPKKNWIEANGQFSRVEWSEILIQDNIVLICDHGHISDFPWSQFLRWRKENPLGIEQKQEVDLFNYSFCCGTIDSPTARIKITSSTGNSSGFDGKWLKCEVCNAQTSLKGLMSVRIKCPGHRPWEVKTGESRYYSGDERSRFQSPPREVGGCRSPHPLKVALTTGNNLYFYRGMSSIYMPDDLFLDERVLELKGLEAKLQILISERNFGEAERLNIRIDELKKEIDDSAPEEVPDSEQETLFKFQEYFAFSTRSVEQINIEEKFLKVKDVTDNLHDDALSAFFDRILRIDKMKITSAQLDFSRVEPSEPLSDPTGPTSSNIFRSRPEDVLVYPVVENYGEGIFFAFKKDVIEEYERSNSSFIASWRNKLNSIGTDDFSASSVAFAQIQDWRLYFVHTFSHLIMRELEFKCGYPTASLSERIYVSNDEQNKMFGCLIYTAEGAEGSMGGLIAQTRKDSLIHLIKSALKRSTICHSDPLCWESEGQGLFDLNFASCFSCSLVSETSCELRNIYLDRRLLVDEDFGMLKEFVK